MTITEINAQRNERGIFTANNDACGWFAISRDRVNMITFYQGKFNFTLKDDVTKNYTLEGFAKKITSLLNKGY